MYNANIRNIEDKYLKLVILLKKLIITQKLVKIKLVKIKLMVIKCENKITGHNIDKYITTQKFNKSTSEIYLMQR